MLHRQAAVVVIFFGMHGPEKKKDAFGYTME
jgi:hypothetical protein